MDTAGFDKNIRHMTALQHNISKQTHRAIESSNVTICMIDALGAYRQGDLKVIQQVADEGKGVVLAVNKWDLVGKDY